MRRAVVASAVVAILGCSGDPTGVSGAEGAAGATGAQGSPGTTGAQGAAGAQGPQGDAGPSGPRGPGVRWLDANGNELKVVSFDPVAGSVYLLDAGGLVWWYRADIDAMQGAVRYDSNRFYASNDCSGPGYKSAFAPNLTLQEYNDPPLYRPSGAAAVKSLNYKSVNNPSIGPGCSAQSGTLGAAVPFSSLKPAGPPPVLALPIYPSP